MELICVIFLTCIERGSSNVVHPDAHLHGNSSAAVACHGWEVKLDKALICVSPIVSLVAPGIVSPCRSIKTGCHNFVLILDGRLSTQDNDALIDKEHVPVIDDVALSAPVPVVEVFITGKRIHFEVRAAKDDIIV